MIRILLLLFVIAGLSGCATAPPKNVDNICSIFKQYPKWHKATKKSEKKWGAPIPVQMAIIYQESCFRANAKPPRKRLLGFIPWCRASSAYGYTQSLDSTWQTYIRNTGNSGATRKNFNDATDFVGWYIYTSCRKLGLASNDTYSQYLAYHEGWGGYAKCTYLQKPELLAIARKVAARSRKYQLQLEGRR